MTESVELGVCVLSSDSAISSQKYILDASDSALTAFSLLLSNVNALSGLVMQRLSASRRYRGYLPPLHEQSKDNRRNNVYMACCSFMLQRYKKYGYTCM